MLLGYPWPDISDRRPDLPDLPRMNGLSNRSFLDNFLCIKISEGTPMGLGSIISPSFCSDSGSCSTRHFAWYLTKFFWGESFINKLCVYLVSVDVLLFFFYCDAALPAPPVDTILNKGESSPIQVGFPSTDWLYVRSRIFEQHINPPMGTY